MSRTPADLVAALLDEEERRHTAAAEARPEVLLPDDLLPGVGGEPMGLREGLRQGGRSVLLVVGLLGLVGEFDTAALAVLAPDIQRSLGISDSLLGVVTAAFGVLFLLGAIPISSLADRLPRTRVAAVSVALWSVVVFATGLVVNGFQLFLTRLGSGLGHSYQLPVTGPLLMDTYPIQARSRVFAVNGGFQLAGAALAPLFAGGVAELAGGDDGWRWVFVATALVSVPLCLAAWALPEPRRGRHEMRAVLGEELDDDGEPLPISLSVAFERLGKIQSFRYFLLGMAALGFALFSTGIFMSLYFERELDLDAFERGLVVSITALPAFLAIAVAGRRSDERFRRSPPLAFGLIGLLIAGYGVLQVVALWMPALALVVLFLAASAACSRAAFAVLPGVISTVIPYRLRSRGSALVGVYLFLFGAFFGAVITGLLSDRFGERTALTLVTLPSTFIGGALIALGARHVRHDISLVVEELREEQDERRRRSEPGATLPVLQVRNLDFSYGRVQVLFDVAFDVQPGEVLALLGTNGAGKSTILRVLSGLGVADRGVVRLNGRTVTYADPELRARLGIVQLAGGKATFGPLTVRDNLEMAGFRYGRDECDRRIERALGTFPALRERLGDHAAALSGGQQQMLALAMALMHDPEVLLIDELSLGLAPVVTQELLAVLADLRAAGQTIVIVEQSLDTALALADRALFLEKGRIRFDGPAHELANRDDLARAVFLGSEIETGTHRMGAPVSQFRRGSDG